MREKFAAETGARFELTLFGILDTRGLLEHMFNADRDSKKDWYSALICTNGHVITTSMERQPDFTTPYCTECGKLTISACPACNVEIRGHYHNSFVIRYSRPAYCHACGKPYPWTEQSLTALRELAHEAEGLSPEEQGRLAQSFDDLLIDTPKTEAAVSRFKLLLPRINKDIGDSIKSILVGIATEAVKKQLGI